MESLAIGIGLSILQLIGPIWGIRNLKESLSDWGLSKKWIGPSIVQAIVVIAAIGGVYGIFRQLKGTFTLHAPRLLSWHGLAQLSVGSVFSYLLYVVIEEWLKRGIVVSALQRILDESEREMVAVFVCLSVFGDGRFFILHYYFWLFF